MTVGLREMTLAIARAQRMDAAAESTPMRPNALAGALLPAWDYGRPLTTRGDFEALVRLCKSWTYICASRNATAVAHGNLRLFVSKPSRDVKVLFPSRAVDRRLHRELELNPVVAGLAAFQKAAEIEELTDHQFLRLFRRVNKFMNRFYLMETTELFLELLGNAYWYVLRNRLGQPAELWPVPAQGMRIVPDRKQFIAGYVYETGMERVPFDESEIIHFKFPSPHSEYYGMGPLAAVIDAVLIGEQMSRYERATFKNMARPDGVLEVDETLKKDEFDRMKEEWVNTYGDTSAAGKVALLEKGVHYKQISLSPRELNFLAGRRLTKEEIMNAFGQNLGMYSEESNRANSEQAEYTYSKYAVAPRLHRMEEKLNEKLLPMFSPDLFCAFDNPVPADEQLRLEQIRAHLDTGYADINEERQQDGLGPRAWGDGPWLSSMLIQAGDASGDQLQAFAGLVAEKVRRRLAADGVRA